MREILFRALTNYGNMVFGSLIIDGFGNHFIKESVRDGNSLKENTYNIKPETIGQYTGLTDKNGNKIFEGDILKGRYFEDNEPKKFIIKYIEECASYRLLEIGTEDQYSIAWTLQNEIIGNIHDKQSDHEKDR